MKSFIRGRAATSVFSPRSIWSRTVCQRSIRLAALAAVAASAGLAASSAQASTISLGAVETVNSVGPSATLGTDGYIFFDTLQSGTSYPTLASQPTYVTSISPNPNGNMLSANGATYSQITINGTAYNSGVLYKNNANGTVYTAATITLASTTVPSEIQLGFLEDNTTNTANDAEVIVSDTQGATPVTTVDPASTKQVNDFYLVDIYASGGDVITIATKQVSGSAALGGITFDTVSAPEPASLSILGLGALGLLARRRRARRRTP